MKYGCMCILNNRGNGICAPESQLIDTPRVQFNLHTLLVNVTQ